jgi:AcrR family transcriptional regulator
MARTATKAPEAKTDELRKDGPPRAGSRKVTARKAASADRVTPGGRRGKASVPAPASAAKPQGLRAERQAQRREAILAAALDEFSARGFAATRLDDVAKRAGVAKGTIYLYFRDKESLFQELVRSMLSPIVGQVEAAPTIDLPARMVIEMIAEVFVREVFGTRRKDVIRLILTEGQRFPKLAEIYYHEVIARAVPAIRALMTRAVARGELPNDALARFPQLLVAPAMVALMWNGLFGRFAPIDVREILRAHIDMLFGERKAP